MTGHLIEHGGERDGRVHALTSAITTIGRDEGNDIVVAGAYVSARHARICWDEGRYVLEDCGSTNGTSINGERLTTPCALRIGDCITLPGQPGVTLVFDDGARTAELPTMRRIAPAFRFDLDTAELWVSGARVPLTAKEYHALSLLHERGGALVSKEELAARVWPEYSGVVADCNIEQLVARLRRKLTGDGALPSPLLTVRGLGYRLVVA